MIITTQYTNDELAEQQAESNTRKTMLSKVNWKGLLDDETLLNEKLATNPDDTGLQAAVKTIEGLLEYYTYESIVDEQEEKMNNSADEPFIITPVEPVEPKVELTAEQYAEQSAAR